MLVDITNIFSRMKYIKMSDAKNDMVVYTQLNDTVLQQIMMSKNEELTRVANYFPKQHIMYRLVLQQAKDLFRKVEQRKLYKLIGQTQLSLDFKVS